MFSSQTTISISEHQYLQFYNQYQDHYAAPRKVNCTQIIIFLILSCFSLHIYGANIKPPNIGNFALPPSQQPGPLISFGQNIIGKNQTQLFLFIDDLSGVKKRQVDIVPTILYGITDNFSVSFNVPIAAEYKQNRNRSSGVEDAFLAFEYAFYNKDSAFFTEQATIATNVTFPTGSTNKNPATGFGAPSFFLGATYNRTYTDWFLFTSQGAVFPTTNNGTKYGNEFLYQFGFGRNLFSINSKRIYAWMIEIDGQYSDKNKINATTDMNSGGNIISVTPSLWVSSKKLIFQFGIGFPITQHLFGNQKKETYFLASNIGLTL